MIDPQNEIRPREVGRTWTLANRRALTVDEAVESGDHPRTALDALGRSRDTGFGRCGGRRASLGLGHLIPVRNAAHLARHAA